MIRWAETNGSESNMYRKNAWIYHDYVIRAFNEDKPYDRFLFEQLAGDTLGQGNATGYLVSGPHVPAASVGTNRQLMVVPNKDLWKINDGEYGTQQWAAKASPDSKEKPWGQLTFTEPHTINRLRLGSNREDFLETDYLEGLNTGYVTPYRVEVQGEDGQWVHVAATPQFAQLSKKHQTRAEVTKKFQALIHQINEEGPSQALSLGS